MWTTVRISATQEESLSGGQPANVKGVKAMHMDAASHTPSITAFSRILRSGLASRNYDRNGCSLTKFLLRQSPKWKEDHESSA
jgi:hypothetical protein